MIKIKLTKGFEAILDDCDNEYAKNKWFESNGYAVRTSYDGGVQKTLRLGREILAINDPKLEVDYINHDTLDHRRENLRIVTRMQSQQNRKVMKTKTSSKYKGVFWLERIKKYTATIRINKKQLHIGCYSNEDDAAKAYNKKATELFGEFAYLNVV